jgi:5'-deoxynucleotidase YfbR-like HD superfamily hydrolase
MNRFQLIRDGGNVKRYHTMQMIGEQTVAAHTFGVIAVILELWPDASGDLIRAAMHHDVVETLTGDTPAHAKWAFPELGRVIHAVEGLLHIQYGLNVPLNSVDVLRLKLADLAELCITAHEQMLLGNRTFKIVFLRGTEYIRDHFGDTKDGVRTLSFIEQYIEQKGRAITGS